MGRYGECFVYGVQWDIFIYLVFMYSKIVDDVCIPFDYVVPDSIPWPLPLRGMEMGLMVNKVRAQMDKYERFYPERKALLDEFKFPWWGGLHLFELPDYLQGPDGVLPPCLRGDEEKKRALEKAQNTRKRGRRRNSFAGGVMTLEDHTVVELKKKLVEKGLRIS